ncbi:endonuclease/exonuclease/phosphatase family protein [Halocola ammonii]
MRQIVSNLLFTIFTLLIITGCSGQPDNGAEAQAPTSNSIQKAKDFGVLFYNVENLFDTENDPAIDDDEFLPEGEKKYTEERFRKKLEDLSRVIAEGSPGDLPAIIGLCEVENKLVVQQLISESNLAGRNYKIVHKDSPDGRGIDVALVYDADLFEVAAEDFYTVEIPFAERPATRDILHAELKSGDESLHVFVNHWPSRYGGQEKSEPKRLAAAEALRKEVDQIRKQDPEANMLMMGDFNDYPINKSVVEVMEANTDSTSGLYNMMATLHEAGLGTYNYRGEWGALDQFWVSSSMLMDEESFSTSTSDVEIIKKEWMLYINEAGEAYPSRTYGGPNYYGGFSDHLPIYIRLELK